MTDVFSVVTTLGAIIGDAASNYALISSPSRNVGGVYPDVTMEETARDEMFITQHPVDVGCPVSDHAYIQPFTVEIKYGFSDSSAQSVGYSEMIYSTFQQLQQSAKPFSVTTGKRAYQNMLARYIVQRTSPQSENSLDISLICQYLVITSTMQGGSSSGPSDGSKKSPAGDTPNSPSASGSVAFNSASIDSAAYGMTTPVDKSKVSIAP